MAALNPFNSPKFSLKVKIIIRSLFFLKFPVLIFITLIYFFNFQLKWDKNEELEWTQDIHPLAENVVDQNMNPYDVKLNGDDISGTDFYIC